MTSPLEDFPIPFSAIGYTRSSNAYLAFPESHRNGGSIQTRVRLPEGISTIQLTTMSNKELILRLHNNEGTTVVGTLDQTTGGSYRTSPPVQIVAADDVTEVTLAVSPQPGADDPVEHVGIVVIPIGPPPAGE